MQALIKSWIGRAADSDRPVFLPLILGTNRQGRLSDSVANFALGVLQRRADATTELIDAAAFDFPRDDYGPSTKGNFSDYANVVNRADGLIIVAPEYNHGYSGRLKTLLDILDPEYVHKAVGVISVSSGPWGGVRMVENLLPVLRTLGLTPSRFDLQFPNASDAFLASGEPSDPKYVSRTAKFIDEVVWLAKALRWGRGNLQ